MTGHLLKSWRTSQSLTIRQVAAKVGVSHQYISQIEKGKRPMSKLTKGVMLRVYGPLEFLKGTE